MCSKAHYTLIAGTFRFHGEQNRTHGNNTHITRILSSLAFDLATAFASTDVEFHREQFLRECSLFSVR